MSKKSKRAKPKGKSLEKTMKDAIQQPVPTDVFQFCVELFQAAARRTYPEATIPRPDPDKPGYYLTDIPINRGMLAVVKETRHLAKDVQQSLLMRLMHFGEMVDAASKDPRFDGHIKPGETADVTLVSSGIQDCYAACRFVLTGDHIAPDFGHLAELVAALPPESESE